MDKLLVDSVKSNSYRRDMFCIQLDPFRLLQFQVDKQRSIRVDKIDLLDTVDIEQGVSHHLLIHQKQNFHFDIILYLQVQHNYIQEDTLKIV